VDSFVFFLFDRLTFWSLALVVMLAYRNKTKCDCLLECKHAHTDACARMFTRDREREGENDAKDTEVYVNTYAYHEETVDRTLTFGTHG
jgi:hypothetical protein